MCERTGLAYRLQQTGILTIGRVGIGIVGIVIVHRPIRIDDSHIVGIGRVGSTQPLVSRRTYGWNSYYPVVR